MGIISRLTNQENNLEEHRSRFIRMILSFSESLRYFGTDITFIQSGVTDSSILLCSQLL